MPSPPKSKPRQLPQQKAITKASTMTRQVISRECEPSSTSNLTSSSSASNSNIQSTPATSNTNSSTPTMHGRHYTPHKHRQFSDSTPPTPRSTPCPRLPNHSYASIHPPYIPSFATVQGLEAERIDLLTALQHADHESTTTLGAICVVQQQLVFSNPLPPHQVRELRRNLRIQRGKAEACMRKERYILQRLGEIAFQVQQIGRWERARGWQNGVGMGGGVGVGMRVDGMAPLGMTAEKGFEDGFFGPMVKQWEQQTGAPRMQAQAYPTQWYGPQGGDLRASQPQTDGTYASSHVVSSPPVAVQPQFWEKGYAQPGIIIPRHSRPNGQPAMWFDNTSGVTSAATTRRNTMFPTSTPLNSRHESIAPQSHGISGLDLGNRMAILAQSSEDGHFAGKPPAAYRRSEPGLLVGQLSGGETQGGGYEYAQGSA